MLAALLTAVLTAGLSVANLLSGVLLLFSLHAGRLDLKNLYPAVPILCCSAIAHAAAVKACLVSTGLEQSERVKFFSVTGPDSERRNLDLQARMIICGR